MPMEEKARGYLEKLCLEIPNRRVGSRGNRAATSFFAASLETLAWEVDCPEFRCIDWHEEGARLVVAGQSFPVRVSPYSLGADLEGPLVRVSTLSELEAADLAGQVVLVAGELAREQLMPKNFVFYNPDHHQIAIRLFESQSPAAIVAATTQDPGLAGAVSPFPLFEDGDFDIPSVYMTAEQGTRLADHLGEIAALTITAERRPAVGCNVLGRLGQFIDGKIVVCAHIDAKDGTPGALDNATGVVVLLLLAELLAGYDRRPGLEIVAFNGEDYYAASGEMLYLQQNVGAFDQIRLAINLDGVGYQDGSTAYSLYGCTPDQQAAIQAAFTSRVGFIEGQPWYQSDHTMFIQHQVPAVALTSDQFTALWTEIAHTPRDHPDIVDHRKLVAAAEALCQIVGELSQ